MKDLVFSDVLHELENKKKYAYELYNYVYYDIIPIKEFFNKIGISISYENISDTYETGNLVARADSFTDIWGSDGKAGSVPTSYKIEKEYNTTNYCVVSLSLTNENLYKKEKYYLSLNIDLLDEIIDMKKMVIKTTYTKSNVLSLVMLMIIFFILFTGSIILLILLYSGKVKIFEGLYLFVGWSPIIFLVLSIVEIIKIVRIIKVRKDVENKILLERYFK